MALRSALSSLLPLALVLAAPVSAQRAGAVEAGLFARATLFDPSLEVTTAIGVGVRASVFLHPRWLVDAEWSTAGADGLAGRSDVGYQPLRLRINLLLPYADNGQMVAGVGVVATRFSGDFAESDAGVTGLFGFRLLLPRSVVARVDATLDYVPSPANGAGNNWHAGVQLGLGYRFGGVSTP